MRAVILSLFALLAMQPIFADNEPTPSEVDDNEGAGMGGHLWPGGPGKTAFPVSWSSDKIMHHIADIATDPNISWVPSKRLGRTRFQAEGMRECVKIRVILESGGSDIVTAYPTR